MITFSNPRRKAVFTDWPLGGGERGQCVFEVESNSKGERISRTTTGKPKFSTYATRACIVDGEDGRTYLLFYSSDYGAITIYSSDFKNPDPVKLGLKSISFRKEDVPFGFLYELILRCA